MSREFNQDDIVQRLNEATAEAKTVIEKLKQADRESYDSIAGTFAADYQLLLDEAEREIADEYHSSGSLTGARVCEINRGMDDYALSVHDVMTLLQELQDQE